MLKIIVKTIIAAAAAVAFGFIFAIALAKMPFGLWAALVILALFIGFAFLMWVLHICF